MEIGLRPSGSPGARETARLIADRLLDARVDDVRRQRPYANVVGRLRGSGDGTVVVGAHYDTKDAIPGFLGANDGASGVAVLLELARSLPRPLPGPSVDLALFDAEEARVTAHSSSTAPAAAPQYVELARGGGQGGSPPLSQIRAMVLFDLVGDCDLQIPPRRAPTRTSMSCSRGAPRGVPAARPRSRAPPARSPTTTSPSSWPASPPST